MLELWFGGYIYIYIYMVSLLDLRLVFVHFRFDNSFEVFPQSILVFGKFLPSRVFREVKLIGSTESEPEPDTDVAAGDDAALSE